MRRLLGSGDRDGRSGDRRASGHRGRDRHGRGIRGRLAPAEVPLSRSRAETFDDLVLDAVEEIELAVRDDPALVARVAQVELAVEDVPPPAALDEVRSGRELPLARVDAARRDRAPRLVVYRRPLELRSGTGEDRGRLVHEVVVEQMADLLEVPVERLDPE